MKWKIKNNSIPEEVKKRWKALNISPLLGRLLFNRGIETEKDLEIFLSPGLRHLPPLEIWPELLKTAEFIAREVKLKKRIAIWGDYDVDGITATALLADFFRQKNISCLTYIPTREQGYGLNKEGLKRLKEQGAHLIITVDCGIAQAQEVEFARDLGLEVIITDHHNPPLTLPPARFILNPKLTSTPYFDLAGVGVAFLLAAGLNRTLPGPRLDLRNFLDLVALGTIADVVDLSLINRILAKNGLVILGETKRPGLIALKEKSGLTSKKTLGSGDIGFILAPRINACGRLKDPNLGLKLLLTSELTEARKIAEELEQLNSLRKEIEEKILEEALLQAQENFPSPGLVVFSPHWHEGVIGIVASRIVQEFYRPCLILTQDGEYLKGSGRSIPEVNLYAILDRIKHYLEGFGGHKMAAGLKLRPQNLKPFTRAFTQTICEEAGETFTPTLHLDAEVNFNALTPSFLKELALLQPFGPKNPRPVFLSPPLQVRAQNFFGNEENHLSLLLRDNTSNLSLEGKIWRQGSKYHGQDFKDKKIRIAFTPYLSDYNDLLSISLKIEQILEVHG
ncbi:MAG: single-stranded-DNA-specific exonuclease [Desulfonauticus sp.]|jgi:single-stranded-DNA-specific exonuclease|nr:single-stranded-DNA-specific exonuclease [Desulfonauticus sp.]